MSKQKLTALHSAQQGVVIIEAMIAILIFSIGVLGIVGMQANMIKNTADAEYRSDAAFIAQQRIGEMWADIEPIGNLNNYVKVDSIPDLLPGGQRSVTKTAVITDAAGVAVGGTFTITVGWTAPGETPANGAAAPCFLAVAHCYTTAANISGG